MNRQQCESFGLYRTERNSWVAGAKEVSNVRTVVFTAIPSEAKGNDLTAVNVL
jgi:hypothetical protein